MASRTTLSDISTPPVSGEDLLAEYAARLKTLFDAAAFPLTSVGGTANVVTASLDPPLDGGGLVDGMKFEITWGAANTGAVTLAINGGSAVPIVGADGSALIADAIGAGLRSLIEYIGGSYRILSPTLTGGGGGGAARYFWQFTSSGTWTKPAGLDPDTMVFVEAWGGGGGGNSASSGGGGGGGGWNGSWFRLGALSSSVTVTVGDGGAVGSNGGSSTFGSLLTAFLGIGSTGANGGRGGGGASNGRLGAGLGGASGSPGADGGEAGQQTGGGGGGGAGTGSAPQNGGNGGWALRGGGGGGAAPLGAGTAGQGGTSVYGGNGGASGSAGVAPGGGGGRNAAGARGEVRVWI